MKKFLIFLVAIIVVVCAGLTTYYFLRNDEVINFTTKDIYCNKGDYITVNELGLTVRRQNKRTTYDYNAADQATQEAVKFDESMGHYVTNMGGEYEIVIATSNSKFPTFTIKVHVGDGSINYPYYVFNTEDLNLISENYGLDKNYELMNDIELPADFKPIGYQQTVDTGVTYKDFTGHFDGNGHTISNLKLTSENNTDLHNAGLFSSIKGEAAVVTDLVIKNANISGNFETAGALAGSIFGEISKIKVEGGNVSSEAESSKVGALAGELKQGSKLTKSYAQNTTVAGNGANSVVGGLVGANELSDISAVYTNNVKLDGKGTLGGLVGTMEIGTDANKLGAIRQSYAYTTSEAEGFKAFVGKIFTQDFETLTKKSQGAAEQEYYENSNLQYLIGNYAIGSAENLVGYDSEKSLQTYFEDKLSNKLEDLSNGFNLVTAKANINEFARLESYIYYGYNASNLVKWDDSIWNTPQNDIPTLKDTDSVVSNASVSYIKRNVSETTVEDATKLKQLLEADVQDKNIVLSESEEYDLGGAVVTPHALKNSIFNGNGSTIKNFTIKGSGVEGLFSTVENSAVTNLTLKEFTFTDQTATTAGAVAGELTGAGSAVENVTVEFGELALGSANIVENFGGIVGSAKQGTLISNCQVTGLNLTTGADIDNVGGIVATAETGTVIANNTVNATLSGRKMVAGLVALNDGEVRDNSGDITINYNEIGQTDVKVAGLVAVNNGVLKNATDVKENGEITTQTAVVSVNININATDGVLSAAGIVAENNGTVSNIVVNGEGVNNVDLTANEVYLAGAVVDNLGSMSNIYVTFARVGKLNVGTNKNYQAAGLVVNNSGDIKVAVVSVDNIEANMVAGVVVNMTSGSIDQVLVGKLNTQTDEESSTKTTTIERNRILGNDMVAGVVVNQGNATITNVQVASVLEGSQSTTLVSLVALIFPDGARLENAKIDSQFAGVGHFYSDTWNDADKSSWGETVQVFGQKGEFPAFAYNLYTFDTASGTMRSVVVNSQALNGFTYSSSKCTRNNFLWIPTSWDMDDTDEANRSFVKYVDANAFAEESSYRGQVDVEGHFKFDLSFDIADASSNSAWTTGLARTGISLRFVVNYINNILNVGE